MAELKMAEFKMAAIIKLSEIELISLSQSQNRGRVFFSESQRR